MAPTGRHVVLVEACDAFADLFTDEAGECHAGRCLGLPIEDIADRLSCDVTVLAWDDWFEYGRSPGNYLDWICYPDTRPITRPPIAPAQPFRSRHLIRRSIPAHDPTSAAPLISGLTPETLGLLNDSDPLFLASYCLNRELAALDRDRPVSLVVLPMWGGLGYVAQMARATGAAPSVDAPFGVVVTDLSARRFHANDEGGWTRPAITRRQMEDLSLALADLVVTFGPRGDEIARAGRLPEADAAVRMPRRVDEAVLDRIATAAATVVDRPRRQVFLHEPQEVAAGVLAMIDALPILNAEGVTLDRAVVSSGPDMRFAPMTPRSFVDYWSSRGFVRELMDAGQWTWEPARPDIGRDYPVRLYPSLFDHLPEVWSELARGSFVLLSAAAAEGLVPFGDPPEAVVVGEEPHPVSVARALARLQATPIAELDLVRRALCRQVVDAHRSLDRDRLCEVGARAISETMANPPAPQDLGRVALLLTDRRQPLEAVVRANRVGPPALRSSTLSVVVTCYNLGHTVRQTVESVWASTRVPDQVILIDDGSRQPDTLAELDRLVTEAAARRMPLTLIRQPNRGLSRARNVGLDHATGAYVSFLDADDLIEPDFYALALEVFRRYPRLGGVACWAYLFGEDVQEMYWNAPQAELPLLFVENTVVVPCVVPTAALRDIGGYDPEQRYNYEDWELSIRLLARQMPIVTIPAYLHRYRVRPDSLFRSMTVAQHQAMRERLFRKHADTISRFAIEVSAQLEHARGRTLYGAKPAPRVEGGRASWFLSAVRRVGETWRGR